MSPIPEFFDNYHLPCGEHKCTINEIEQRFLTTYRREVVWQYFDNSLSCLMSLGLFPDILLINGSFVTGRSEPNDVDSALLIKPCVAYLALMTPDQHDKDAICLFLDPQNERAIRVFFGAHILIFPDETGLELASKLFQYGKGGQLREPDPLRDPPWVKKPHSKGILRVEGGDIYAKGL